MVILVVVLDSQGWLVVLIRDLAKTVNAINGCNEAGVKLMTGLQRRFDPNFCV